MYSAKLLILALARRSSCQRVHKPLNMNCNAQFPSSVPTRNRAKVCRSVWLTEGLGWPLDEAQAAGLC